MSVFVERALSFAALQPHKVIVVDKWRRWTWDQLVDRALSYKRVVGERFSSDATAHAIPIVVGRGGDVAAAVLGILMAGRAAAPISARQPVSRLRRCIDQLGATVVLDARAPEEREDLGQSLIVVEDDAPGDISQSVPSVRLASIVYILFTSGSTGEPKGVMVSHGNILNTLIWSADQIEWRDGDVMGGATQFSFDIANFDLFTCFYFGVPLSIFPDPSDVRDLTDRIAETGVTSIFAVPAFFAQFVRAGVIPELRRMPLRRILSGGDFFPPAHVLEWLNGAPEVEVFNVWGPTETSIVNTMHKVGEADVPLLEKGQYPPVGRHHPRMPFVLMGEDNRVVTTVGERGEIWMLGDCVSIGYLGPEDADHHAYVTHDGMPAFRTQDIGYLSGDGSLNIAGRTGAIVKVAGYRIDLGEVESALTRLPQVHLAGAFVNEAIVGINELKAAVELRPGVDRLDIFAAKRRLRQMLPSYMVPKRLFVLPVLPLNQNGKVDRGTIKRIVTAGAV